jgi:hypothetical protein
MDSVVQEIDIETGLLLFLWDSLDHVPLTASYTPPPSKATQPLDPFHVNSVDQDRDGNLLISARSTSAVYKVHRQTGKVISTLGGKHSSFKIAPARRLRSSTMSACAPTRTGCSRCLTMAADRPEPTTSPENCD